MIFILLIQLFLILAAVGAPLQKSNSSRCAVDSNIVIIGNTVKLDDQCREFLLGQKLIEYEAIEVLRVALRLLGINHGREMRATRYLQPAQNLVRMLTGEEIVYPTPDDDKLHYGRSTPAPDQDYSPRG